MVLVALVLRLIVVGFLYPERLNSDRDHWRFAGEAGRIARSIVEGKGFSSPLFGDTGPTAWMTPVYPYLVALSFRLLGVYSKASAIAMLSLNGVFSALTCLPVFFMARRSFGEIIAIRAGWAWALFPYAIYFSADFIWSTVLTTFLLALAFAVGLRLEKSVRIRDWVGFGILAGIAALSDPIAISVLPLLGLWMWSRGARQSGNWLLRGSVAGLAFIMVVAPWFVRNYRVFGTMIPFRDNFGLELYVGNHGEIWHFAEGPHPSNSDEEWQEYRQLGELRYMQRKQGQAVKLISRNKGEFAWLSFRRALYIWTNYWSFSRRYLEAEPFDVPAIFLTTALSVLALWGLWIGWRNLGLAVIPYAIALFFFPLVYYVTHLEDYYRRPADPFFVVLAAYAVTAYLQRQQQQPSHRTPMPQAQVVS
jgi:4-amino-4-deoxy-L-arabinose transferase-like glycosyltransferase